MNNVRRKTIDTLLARYGVLHAELIAVTGRFNDLKDDLDSVREEEQDAYDNLPESMQEGDKGEVMQAAIGSLDDAIALIESITEFAESNDDDEFVQLLVYAKL